MIGIVPEERPEGLFRFKEPTLLEQVQKAITFSVSVVVAILLATVVWILLRPPSLSYPVVPFPLTEKRIFAPGEVVPVLVSRCSTISGTHMYNVTLGFRNMVTDEVVIASSSKVTVKEGCKTAVSYLHKLPKNLLPGLYQVVGAAEIQDLFGPKLVDFESDPFKVQ